MGRDVIIVGAGHNGLVCAFYLARAGLNVEVIEAREIIGGACVTEELIPGYKFSTCANVVCWLNPQIVGDMGLMKKGIEFSVTGEPVRGCFEIYTQLFPGGQSFTWWQDQIKLNEEIARYSKADVKNLAGWNSFWKKAADIFGPFLLTPPPTIEKLYARAEEVDAVNVFTTVLTTPIAHLADRFFESQVMRNHVVAPHDLGSVYDTGTGIAAALASSVNIYNENNLPLPRGYVKGGMGNITLAMAMECKKKGVIIQTGNPIKQILTEGGKVSGVLLSSGDVAEAEVVISNADPKRTFLRLIPEEQVPEWLYRKVSTLRTDCAPMKFHCALSEPPLFKGLDDSELHARGCVRICADREYFERAWEDALHGILPRSPFMEIMIPSMWDDTLAPPGKHTLSIWSLFAPVHLKEGTWPELREEMAERFIGILDEYLPNFRRSLIDYILLTPYDLEERVNLTDGNIHHIDIIPSQMLWQRPLPELAHYRTPIKGLYLCGAGTHPYGEVTGVPGHNAAHAVLQDFRAL